MKKFKRLIDPNKEEAPMQSILGGDYEAHFVEPPLEMEPDEFSMDNDMSIANNKSQSLDTYNREALERDSVLRGYHHQRDGVGRVQPPGRSKPAIPEFIDELQTAWSPQSASPQMSLSLTISSATKRSVEGTRGHARDPLEEDFSFLFVGPSTFTGSSLNDTNDDSQPSLIFEEPESSLTSETPETHLMEEDGPIPIVSESPGAAEYDIYETAYREEIDRIRRNTIPHRGTVPKMYLTRRVDGKDDVMKMLQEEGQEQEGGFQANQQAQQPTSKTFPEMGQKMPVPSSSFSSAVGMLRTQLDEQKKQSQGEPTPSSSSPSTSHPEQTAMEPAPSTTTNREQASPPENPKSKLRCLLGRVRGS